MPVGQRSLLFVALAALVLFPGCKPKKSVQEKQRELDQARRDLEAAEEAKRIAALPKIDAAKLEPFWDDPAYLRVSTGKPCPDGLWSLFSGPAPGEGLERERNQSKRAELATKVRAATFVARLPFAAGVALHDWKAKTTVLVDASSKAAKGDDKAAATLPKLANCAACHGTNGKSVEARDTLAGQRFPVDR